MARWSRIRRDCSPWLAFGAVIVLAAAGPTGARAQPIRIGPDTQLRTVEFAFPRGQSFMASELRKQIAHPTRGKHPKLRSSFAWLPMVSPVTPAPFDPLEFQRDVARLRNFYHGAGFVGTTVGYEVRSQPGSDLLDARFVITEGEPLRLAQVTVAGPDSTPPVTWLPEALLPEWRTCLDDLREAEGKRTGASEVRGLEATVLGWFRDHGYPFVTVQAAREVEAAANALRLRIDVDPGPRARIGAIEVTGAQKIDPGVVRKNLPFAPGDWYSARQVSEGQRALTNLGLFHLAIAEVPPQPAGDTLQIRVRLEEGKTRLVTGEFGYLSDAGITLKGEWTHRNFRGGARTLTLTAVGQTGLWAWEDDPERLARGTVSLAQPGVIGRYTSLVASPYLEYRDDYRDFSQKIGFDGTLVTIRESWLRTLSLQYAISSRRVFEYRASSGGDLSIFELIEAALDSLSERNNHSAFTLAATLGRQDHPVKPRRVALLRPSIEVTTPSGINTAEYTRLDVSATLLHPVRKRVSVWARAAVGRIYPFGKSIPGADGSDRLERYLELRDYTFTAGGTGDVRGWESRLLGPKTPDILIETEGDATDVRAERYVPVTGLARMTLSTELRLPFPRLSAAWASHVFLDAGRVWSPNENYIGSDVYDQERFFFSSGFGIDRDTPVGPVRLSLGYILNPSALDVLKPQEFIDAVESGTLGERRTAWNRRLHVHLAIGTGF